MFCRGQGNGSQLADVHFQRAGDHLKKTACTGSTFVIHHKVMNLTVFVQADGLAVLAADVEDCADPGIEIVCSFSVTADFSNIFIRKGNADTSVSGRHNSGQVFSFQLCFLKHI